MAERLTADLLIGGGGINGTGINGTGINGTGINGTGIARDAAGRGPQVVLCEQGDLAGATSSASGKLTHGVLLIKGSRIVPRRLYDGDRAFIPQNDDRRVIFVIPYEGEFSLVGTTDVPLEGDPAGVEIGEAETECLCRAVSRYFRRPITPGDVVHGCPGVRPLHDDASTEASAVTRDCVPDLDLGGAEAGGGVAPILSVSGGKITTYRRLAEHAMEKLLPHLPAPRPAAWTAHAPLPGGDLPGDDFDRFLPEFRAARPWLPPDAALRLARAHGTRAERVLGGARDLRGLGADLGAGPTEAELDYLVREEWARTADGVLRRRSKLDLRLAPAQQAAVAEALRRRVSAPEAARA